MNHGDQITVGDFVIHFFVGVPFVKPSAQNKASASSSPQNVSSSVPSHSPPMNEPSLAFSTVPTINEIPDQFSETPSSQDDIPSFSTPESPSSLKDIPPSIPKSRPSAPPPVEEDTSQSTPSVPFTQFPLKTEPSTVSEKSFSSPSVIKDIPDSLPPDPYRIKPLSRTSAEEAQNIQPLRKEEIIPPPSKAFGSSSKLYPSPQPDLTMSSQGHCCKTTGFH